MKYYKEYAAFVAMGAAALAGQVMAMRELMAELRGNELSLALTLGVWLFLVGLFSWAGTRLTRSAVDKKRALSWASAILAVLMPLFVAAPRIILPMLGYAPGELVPAGGMFLVIFLTLILASPLVGLMFPLAVGVMEELRPGGAGRVYALEALGSFLAGLAFTFIAAPFLTPLQAASAVSLMCLAASYALSLGGGSSAFRAAALLTAALTVLLFYFASGLELRLYNYGMGVGRVVQAVASRYGVITVHELNGQHAVFTGGEYAFSVPDRDVAEQKAHLPMTVHPAPSDVLLIGGGGEGVLAEVLKHPVTSVDYVELDPKLILVSMRYMTAAGRAPFYDLRVHVHYTDGRHFVKDPGAKYDLVMVCLPGPSTAAVNRYYTAEFFGEVRRALKPGGILSISLPSSPNYIGKRQQALSGSMYHTLKAVFPYVRVTPEDTNYFFASSGKDVISLDTGLLARRFGGRCIDARSFNQYTIPYALQPGRVTYVEDRLAASSGLGINRDFRPAAYLYALALWGEVAGLPAFDWFSALSASPSRFFVRVAGCLFAAAVVFYALFIRGRLGRKVLFAVVSTGFAGMVVEVAMLLSFQAYYGYLYEMLGLLMALFMAGLFVGSRAASGGRAFGLSPRAALTAVEAGFMLLCLGAGLTAFYPGWAVSGPALSAVIFLAGLLTGAEYPLAVIVSGGGHGRQEGLAGRIYGMDLIGSSMGALLSGLVLIPLLGIAFTALSMLILKAFSTGFLLMEKSKA